MLWSGSASVFSRAWPCCPPLGVLFQAIQEARHNLQSEVEELEKSGCGSGASHPITRIPEYFELPQEEMYGERFDIPKPDEVVFISWFPGGEVFRSGCTLPDTSGNLLLCSRPRNLSHLPRS